MADKAKYKFSIYCNDLNFKEVAKKVESLGYILCPVITTVADINSHRFGCIGKSRTPEEDHAILSEIEGVSLVAWRKI